MEKRRVVVTGLGTVNPLGNTVAESRCQSRQMRHRPHYPVRYHRF